MKKAYIAILILLVGSVCNAEVASVDDPMHFYGVAWRDTSTGSATASGKYAKAMGYKYIMLRTPGSAPNSYLPSTYNDSVYDGLKFYLPDPYTWVTHAGLGFSTLGSASNNWDTIGTADKNWIKDYVAWNGSSTTTADNLKAGWENDDGGINLLLDLQQARVRSMAVNTLVSIIQSYVDVNGNDFKFAGWQNDIFRLYGDVHVDVGNGQTTWTYWTGAESCALHTDSTGQTIVHDIATYSDATSAFYQELNTALNAAFGTGTWHWGGHPWNAWNSNYTAVDEYIYAGSLRSDRALITPDFLFSESHSSPLHWSTNATNFGQAMNMTRSKVGCSSGMLGESIERQIAIAAGTSSSNFNFFGHFGNDMSSVMTIEAMPKRTLVYRAIPGWLKVWGIPNTSPDFVTEIIGGTLTARAYKDGELWSYIGKDIAWGRHPDNSNKIISVFSANPAVGSVTINANESLVSVYSTDGFMQQKDDVTNQFTVSGKNIIPTGITPSTDGAAFIMNVAPLSVAASGGGSVSASGSGSIVCGAENESIPVVYGAGWNADGLTNLEVGKYSGRVVSYRFRANQSNIAYGVNIFLVFEEGGYYAGNGGQVLLQLQTDDGTENHLPSGTVLTSSLVTNPMAQWNRLFTFASPVQLQKGNLYHLVFTNPAPDPINNWVSLDCLFNLKNVPSMQPGISDIDFACIWKPSGASGWTVNYYCTPIFCLYYNDGSFQGQGYRDAWVEAPFSISGENKAREIFTVSGGNQTVSRVLVRLKKSGSPGDLKVRLEYSNGTLIEEGTISASLISTSYNWVTYTFENERTLESGKSYNLVLSAPVGDSYQTYPIQDGSGYGFDCPEVFQDGHFQTTTGGAWNNFNNGTEFDMQFYFK